MSNAYKDMLPIPTHKNISYKLLSSIFLVFLFIFSTDVGLLLLLHTIMLLKILTHSQLTRD